MKKLIHIARVEFRRGFLSKMFLLYVVGMTVLILYGAEEYFLPGCSYQLLNPDVGYPCKAIITGLQGHMLIFFLPVLAALPSSGTYLDEKEHGYLKYYLPRCGRNIYTAVRTIIPIVLAALGSLIAVLLATIVCYMVFVPYITEWKSSISGKVIDLIGSLCCSNLGIMLTAAFYSAAGSLFGVRYLDRYMAYGGPFVLSYLMVIITTRYIHNLICFNPRYWGSGRYLPVNLLLVIVSAVIYAIVLHTRIREV